MSNKLNILAKKLGDVLTKKKFYLATAESCTGGGIAQVITSVPGSSKWFDRGFVTYSNQAKIDLLGVKQATIDDNGAVSTNVVHEMVEGGLEKSIASIVVSVSGVAGPGGGTTEKPVGTVIIGWGLILPNKKLSITIQDFCFVGNRHLVRNKTIHKALEGVIERII